MFTKISSQGREHDEIDDLEEFVQLFNRGFRA